LEYGGLAASVAEAISVRSAEIEFNRRANFSLFLLEADESETDHISPAFYAIAPARAEPSCNGSVAQDDVTIAGLSSARYN